MSNLVWLSLVLILSSLNDCQTCSIEICFSWKVSSNSLTLTCKVNSLHHRIFIDNQFRIKVADCIPLFCDSYNHNASIIQTLSTNETIYTVYGKIDNKVNGNWTCRHGTNLDIARVEVTVLTGDDVANYTKKEWRVKSITVVKHCIERLVCYTLIAFVVMIAVCAASNWIIREICWNVHTGKTECTSTKLCSAFKTTLIGFGAPLKTVLLGICLLFMFGIPVSVSFLENGTCSIIAIAAVVFMGITLGGTTSIVLFGRKMIASQDNNEEKGSSIMFMANHNSENQGRDRGTGGDNTSDPEPAVTRMEDNVSEYNQESDKESNSMLMSMTERSSEERKEQDIQQERIVESRL